MTTGVLLRGHRATLGIDEALQLDVPDERVDVLAPGQHIHHGQYHIHGVLGRGSFATVYDAEHLGLARRVAIKVPLLNCDKKALLHERFVREARMSALVQHPNVLAIYDAGSLADGTPFLVLERVEGDSLNERIEHGVLPVAEVIEVGRQLAMALCSLAAAGIVHRDIKPANVMLHKVCSGVYQVKLVDLGVARRRTAFQAPLRLTMQGELIGTPQYMSSEQLRGEEVDARTDIYGTAAVLYEAVTGKPPHESTCFSDYMVAALSQPVLRPRSVRSDCPADLERVLLRALECDPAQRQASPEQLLEELDACKLAFERSEAGRAEYDVDRRRAQTPSATTAAPTPVPPAPTQVSAMRASAADPSAQAQDEPASISVRGWLTRTRRASSSAPRIAIAVGGLLLLFGGSRSLVGQGTPRAEQALLASETTARIDATLAGTSKPDAVPARFAPLASVASVHEQAPSAPPPAREVATPGEPALHARGDTESPSERRLRTRRAHEEATANAEVTTSELPATDKHELVPPSAAATAPAPPTAPRPSTRYAAPSPVPQLAVDAQPALVNALKAFASGRLSEAKASYQQVLRSNPSQPAALRGLGLVATALHEPDTARQALRRYLQLAPDAPDAAQIAARLRALDR
jgi:serine/threonine protein kinase